MLLSLNQLKYFLIIMSFCCLTQAQFRVGGMLGFGGTGLTSTTKINEVDITVKRSDGPILISFYAEYLLNINMSLALDHLQGVTLNPYSSGVSFSGATYKYYYLTNIPSTVVSKSNQSTLLLKEYSPYIGGSLGLATGTISRQNDLVPEISAQGVYMGIRAGVDYQFAPNLLFRGEIMTGMTPGSSGLIQSSLSAFGLLGGITYIINN